MQFFSEITDFINGDEFNKCAVEKVKLCLSSKPMWIRVFKSTWTVMKSAHIRILEKKASTFMNINPSELSESSNHHTHYMTFIGKRKYVEAFWSGNPEIERCWCLGSGVNLKRSKQEIIQ